MKFIIVLIAAAAASLGGCASTDTPATNESEPSELIYRTGSNIPVRNTKPMTKEEKQQQAEEAKRALEATQRGGAASTRPL